MTPHRSADVGTEERCVTDDPPAHSADGVDLTLIRWMLSMTPSERLETLQRTVQSIKRLRRDATDT